MCGTAQQRLTNMSSSMASSLEEAGVECMVSRYIDQSEGSIAQFWPLIGQNFIFLKGVRPSVLAAESCDNTFSQQNPPMYQKMIE